MCVDVFKINIKILLDILNYFERKVVYFDILNFWIFLGFFNWFYEVWEEKVGLFVYFYKVNMICIFIYM